MAASSGLHAAVAITGAVLAQFASEERTGEHVPRPALDRLIGHLHGRAGDAVLAVRFGGDAAVRGVQLHDSRPLRALEAGSAQPLALEGLLYLMGVTLGHFHPAEHWPVHRLVGVPPRTEQHPEQVEADTAVHPPRVIARPLAFSGPALPADLPLADREVEHAGGQALGDEAALQSYAEVIGVQVQRPERPHPQVGGQRVICAGGADRDLGGEDAKGPADDEFAAEGAGRMIRPGPGPH